MFSLAPLSIAEPLLWSGREQLPIVAPRFVLPLLDENAPGTERLLDGLTNVERVCLWDSPSPPSRKGKEKQVSPRWSLEDSRLPLTAEEGSIWEQAGEGDAGPSTLQTFKPLRTWDILDQREKHEVALLSDSPALFDALATCLEPPVNLPRLVSQVLPPENAQELLHLLIRATMGTTTTHHVVWDKRHSRFRRSGGRIQGLGPKTSSQVSDEFLDIGTALRRVEIMLDAHATTLLTPTHHAFLHAVSTYATYTKQLLADAVEKTDEANERWLGSAAALAESRELALLLCGIMCWPIGTATAQGLPSRASSLLSHLHSHLLAQLSTSSNQTPSSLAMAYLLSHTSGPFLDLLHGWLGLSPSLADQDLDPTSQPWQDLGITRSPLPPASETGEPRWSFDFSSRKMPGFIPRETRRTLFEAGKSLRLLREASGGQHPLCATSWKLEVGWGWGEMRRSSSEGTLRRHVRIVNHEVEQWRREVKNRIKPSGSSFRLHRPKQRKRLPQEFTHAADEGEEDDQQQQQQTDSDAANEIDALWAQFDQAPGSHLVQIPTPLWAPSPLSSLYTFITHHQSVPLIPPDCPTLELFITSHLLAPLLAHAKLVSTSLVSLYLDDLDLLGHYDVLRAYFLGGNVEFGQRVSGALFGKEEAGAGEALGLGKRARTRARLGLGGIEGGGEEGEWGIGLGLGLSERARWPPGGAELAYALRMTLVDDTPRKGVWEGIEERVSFAVKSLPEDDQDGSRARWMDPQAIEALDFLYLAYSAPTFITLLLPTALMAKYQTVHNLLLRLCRVKTVLRTLFIDSVHHTPVFDEPVKRGVDSRVGHRASLHSPRVVRELFPPGSAVAATLQRVRFRMSAFTAALEGYVLDTAIESNWSVMRRKLDRLRRRGAGSEDSTAPVTPVDESEGEADLVYDQGWDEEDGDEEGDDELTSGLVQLHSIHSLVVYHHLVVDRILRDALLGPSAGQHVTMKVLLGLFGCILDLGKIVKQVARGSVGWESGAECVQSIASEWYEREGVFLHALERLSLRTSSKDKAREMEDRPSDERDLEILLGGHVDEEGSLDRTAGADGGGLGELLLRLRLVAWTAPK